MGEEIIKMNSRNSTCINKKCESFKKELEIYWMMTTRGCPHSCSYCCNNALRKIYKDNNTYVRFRSPENIVKELELVKNKFRFIKSVMIIGAL